MDFYSACAAPVALSSGESTQPELVPGLKRVAVQRLGLVPYVPTWDLQEQLLAETVAIKAANRQAEAAGQPQQPTPNHVLCCQHPPTYTLGKSGKPEHLLLDDALLDERVVDASGDVHAFGRPAPPRTLRLALGRAGQSAGVDPHRPGDPDSRGLRRPSLVHAHGFPLSRGPNPGSSTPVDDVLVTPTDAFEERFGVP